MKPEDLNKEDNQEKSLEDYPKKEEKRQTLILNKLIFIICCSVISFVGLNFISCNFMLPGSINSANLLGGLKNPPPLKCEESERRGYEILLSVLTTVIALRTKIDN